MNKTFIDYNDGSWAVYHEGYGNDPEITAAYVGDKGPDLWELLSDWVQEEMRNQLIEELEDE